MRTRNRPPEKRRPARRILPRLQIGRLSKVILGLSAVVAVVVPTLAASDPASAGSLPGNRLGFSSLLGGLLPGLAPASPAATTPLDFPAVAPAGQRPGAPTNATVIQDWTLPDVVVNWKNPEGGVPSTGAIVQLNQVVNTTLVPVTQIACGSCTTATLRGLTFGDTYEANVISTSASGLGTGTRSAPVTLTTTCPVVACLDINTTQSIASANHAYSGVLDSLYSVGNDQFDGNALGVSLFRSSPPRLSPTTFDWSSYDVAASDGAKSMVNLGDEWLEAYGGSPPLPWANWSVYSSFITTTVKNMVASGHKIDYWEVYNEPGGDDLDIGPGSFAAETPQLLLQEFLVAYQAIKAADPSAQVVGPDLPFWSDYPGQWGASYHGFDMATFLSFAAANHIQLAALTWHEITDNTGPNPEEDSLSPNDIIDHVNDARSLLAEHPSLGQPQIIIDEFGMPEVQKIPGWDVAYLAALADAGVTLASRSCWDGDCSVPDLDGLLFPDGFGTSADFYDRLIYASMSGDMVPTASSSDTVSALGAFNRTTNTFVGLIGRDVGCYQNLLLCPGGFIDGPNANAAEINITMNVPWSSGIATVVLSRISGATPEFEASPPGSQSFSQVVAPAGDNQGTVTFTIPSFADGDAYGVTVTRASS